jgi:exonuclease III
MSWNFLHAVGTAGGILMGFRNQMLEVISWEFYVYCASAIVKNIYDKVTWRLIVVYGSPYEDTKLEFLRDLDQMLEKWQDPTLVGGDFNLVRNQKEKSNGIVNFTHMDAFNDLINRWALIEIKDCTRAFFWTNNQEKPIMAKLDTVLASVEWDSRYLMTKMSMLPKQVSDHNPLLISFGARLPVMEHVFRFEKWWLEMDDFADLV